MRGFAAVEIDHVVELDGGDGNDQSGVVAEHKGPRRRAVRPQQLVARVVCLEQGQIVQIVVLPDWEHRKIWARRGGARNDVPGDMSARGGSIANPQLDPGGS